MSKTQVGLSWHRFPCCVNRDSQMIYAIGRANRINYAIRNTQQLGRNKTGFDCTEGNTIWSICVTRELSNTCSISGGQKILFSLFLWYTLDDKIELKKCERHALQYALLDNG